jgi:predicted deacylase
MPKSAQPLIRTYGTGRPVVAVIGSLHGEEPVGKKVINALRAHRIKKGTLITVIGNPQALQKKTRYIETDLNRCFPGKKNGTHEEQLAHQLLPLVRKADYCIDIHSTSTNTQYAAIIKKKSAGILKLLSLFRPEHAVLMPKGVGDGSLINFCRTGVSLEYGKHTSRETYRRSLEDVLIILSKLGVVSLPAKKAVTRRTEFFLVYGTEPRPKGFRMKPSLRNFSLVRKGDVLGTLRAKKVFAHEDFYPVLFGPKSYKDIMGFKAKKLKKF